MKKRKAVESAKPTPGDAARLRALAETPRDPPGRELTLDELRQRAAASKGEEAKFYAQLLAIKEGKVKVWQPSNAPLPKWAMQGDGLGSSRLRTCGYACDDPAEQAFALNVMMMTGFSIADFDVWLDSIGLCAARTELMIRREWVAEALQANNEDGVRRHLEWMVNRRREIQDKQVLMPLAQRDAKRQAGTRKPRGSRMPLLDAWIENQNLSQSNDELWASIPESYDDANLYGDGDSLIEIKDGKERSITRAGFDKRITAARKSAVSN